MKKPYHWLLVIVLLILAAPAVIYWDAHRRAHAALVRHEARVAGEIGALRADLVQRHAPMRNWEPYEESVGISGIVPGTVLGPGALLKAKARNDAGIFAAYEEGWEGGDDRLLAPRTLPLHGMSPREHLLPLAAVQHLTRGSGLRGAEARLDLERETLTAWGGVLSARTLPVPDLEFMARGLALLETSRPPLKEAFAAEAILWERLLIRAALGEGPESPHFVPVPDFKSLYSEKLRIVQMLNTFESDARVREAWFKIPYSAHQPGDLVLNHATPFHVDVQAILTMNARVERLWSIARLCTAIALHEAQKGSFPQSLEDLVPGYLTRVPTCALTGLPFKYGAGDLTPPGPGEFTWTILGHHR